MSETYCNMTDVLTSRGAKDTEGRKHETLEEDSLLQANERVRPWRIHIDVWQNQYNIV